MLLAAGGGVSVLLHRSRGGSTDDESRDGDEQQPSPGAASGVATGASAAGMALGRPSAATLASARISSRRLASSRSARISSRSAELLDVPQSDAPSSSQASGWSRHPVWRGVLHTLPLALLILFALVPAVSARIFSTFSCTRFGDSDEEGSVRVADDDRR